LKANINSVKIHPQLSNNGHPVDDVLVGAGSNRSLETTKTSSVTNGSTPKGALAAMCGKR
jgi:hypothetical protein